MTYRLNALDQALDIAGSLTQNSSMTLANEPNFLGAPITGQTGTTASITVFSAGTVTITGLTGMTLQSIGRFITISGAAAVGNNGTFLIASFISATSVTYVNSTGSAPDANNGAISWTERNPYSLEDDLNYARSDRTAIKGVSYSSQVPTYTRPSDTITFIPANLSNIAGKTTDAKALVNNRKFENVPVIESDTFVTLFSSGNLKHAGAVDRTGVPVFDGYDLNNYEACYVEIASQNERELIAVGGAYDGYRIFGLTRAGSSISPDFVEVVFRAVPRGAPISDSIAYTWDGYQPTTVDMYYPFRERIDLMSETALRITLVNGLISDSSATMDIDNILMVIGISSGDTSLNGLLTNTGAYFPFFNLPDATPSVVEALNTLNEQIGSRDYTGSILTDGYTITQSLQQLADAISSSNVVRTIERLAVDVNANVAHTLPGGITYTLDATDNGRNMWVYTRGILRDPGAISTGNDYSETSTTQVTFYAKQKAGDHINYMIFQ